MEESNSLFTSAMTLTQLGVSQIPQSYVLPPSKRPNATTFFTSLPTIDLSKLQNPSLRTEVIDEIRMACGDIGCFQVHINICMHFYRYTSQSFLFLLLIDYR